MVEVVATFNLKSGQQKQSKSKELAYSGCGEREGTNWTPEVFGRESDLNTMRGKVCSKSSKDRRGLERALPFLGLNVNNNHTTGGRD